MKTIKFLIASYIGSNIGILFGQYVIIEISGEKIDLIAIVSTGLDKFPPVLLGMVLSWLIGTIAGFSFIKKGRVRALIGGSGAFLGLTAATLAIYNLSIFQNIYYLIYPLFSYSGWELGMYIFKNNIQPNMPVESSGKN
ncbi:MAG: hypothetical protein IIA58_00740 [Candidatus Marinimicrobia bacterium]|nr:hypothetical protein [Candidatus Neomarinimicrobiota bacterium]